MGPQTTPPSRITYQTPKRGCQARRTRPQHKSTPESWARWRRTRRGSWRRGEQIGGLDPGAVRQACPELNEGAATVRPCLRTQGAPSELPAGARLWKTVAWLRETGSTHLCQNLAQASCTWQYPRASSGPTHAGASALALASREEPSKRWRCHSRAPTRRVGLRFTEPGSD